MAIPTKLKDYSVLLQERQNIDHQIEQYIVKNRSEALRNVLDMVDLFGFTVADVFPSIHTACKRTVPAKYRHPNEPSQLWTGRGSQPHWVVEYLAKGGCLDDLLIKNQAKDLVAEHFGPIDRAG